MFHRTVKKFMYYNESAHKISYTNMVMSSLQYIIFRPCFRPQHSGPVLNFSLVCSRPQPHLAYPTFLYVI